MLMQQLMGGAADVLKMHDEGDARRLGDGRREGAL
jgi:hypothetical protein